MKPDNIIDFPPSCSMRPEQAIGACARVKWRQFIGIGLTEDGEFEVINSQMTAAIGLWLVTWAQRWALGLDDEDDSDRKETQI